MDLCYLGAGRVDAFWEFGLGVWDIAAGTVIIREAGGRVSDLQGGTDFLKGDIVASNGRLHNEMLRVMQGSY